MNQVEQTAVSTEFVSPNLLSGGGKYHQAAQLQPNF